MAVKTINDTYEISDFTNAEKNAANAVMKNASLKLGVNVGTDGKLDVNSFNKDGLKLSTVDMIEKFGEKMVAELDACKSKEPEKVTPKEE